MSLADWSSLSDGVNSLGTENIKPLSFLEGLTSSGVPALLMGTQDPTVSYPLCPSGLEQGCPLERHLLPTEERNLLYRENPVVPLGHPGFPPPG